MIIEEELTQTIIGACIEVHRHLGPGLLESAYRQCLCFELSSLGLVVQKEVPLPVSYKGVLIDCSYKLDLVVEDKIILEIKSIEKIIPVHEAQLLSYMKLSGRRLGLLVNFNVRLMADGIKRRIL